jgi:NlpC/P60 family
MNDETSRVARRSVRSAIVSGSGALLVLLALGYAGIRLNALRQEVSTLESRKVTLQDEIRKLEANLANSKHLYEGATKELNEGFQKQPVPKSLSETVNRELVLSALQGKRREALQLAFDLYDKQVPFKWGGKTPSEGLDTSGFVAYILSRVGILDHPERYWSGLLRERFRAKVSSASELRPGDLIFEENKACWFVLNNRYTIGMVPNGIVIAEPTNFNSNIIGYGRVPYDRAESQETR